MNMKKIWSMVVVLTMLLSILTFTAYAAGETIEITYENITDPGKSIELNDLFYAVIKIKGIKTELSMAAFQLNYDKSVVQLAKTDGGLPLNFGVCSNSAIATILNYTDLDVLGYDGKAFEGLGATINTTNATVDYTISSIISDGSSYYAYPLTPSDETNGFTLVKMRFKALNYGNANFTFTSLATKFINNMADSEEFFTANVTQPTIASAGNSVTYATTGSTAGAAPTDATLYANGATVTVAGAGTLVKDRYTFDGWFDGTNKYAIGVSYTMPATAVTFTPVWKAIPVESLPVVTGDVTKETTTVKYIDKVTKQEVENVQPVVTIPCKVPASIVAGDIGVVEFGISLGGVRFPAKTNANTFATLDGNGGKYIIKLVDPSLKLVGKTFMAFNYFGASKSAEVPVTISAN